MFSRCVHLEVLVVWRPVGNCHQLGTCSESIFVVFEVSSHPQACNVSQQLSYTSVIGFLTTYNF